MQRTSRSLALFCALALASAVASGDALIKPVPQPPLANMPKEKASQLERARADFEKARVTLVADELAAAYAQLGALYARAGFDAGAETALANAAALAPQDGRWVYLQGLFAQSRKRAAQTFFERALQLDAEYAPIRVALASTLLEQGAYERAGKLVDEYLAANQDQPKVYALKGEIALKQRRYADAGAALQQALKLDPKATLLYASLADALQGQGDSAAAAAARAKAGDVPPRFTDPLGMSLLAPWNAEAQPQGAASPLEQAAFLMSVRQYAAARAQLDQVLKQKPDDIAALMLSARMEALAGANATAQQRAGAALKIAPNNALALLTQGVVLETAGDEAGARGWYEKAAAANAELAEPHQLLADGAMRQGQFAKAAEQYRVLIRLDPTRGDRYAHLAAALSADGRCADALKQLGTDLNEHPRMPLLVQTQVRVASTCRAASAADRTEALQRGNNLYRQQPTPANTEALALAAAANGKWEDATQLQGAAIFELVKNATQAEIALYKTTFQSFQAKQVPDKPWPAAHPLFRPARLQPAPPETK